MFLLQKPCGVRDDAEGAVRVGRCAGFNVGLNVFDWVRLNLENPNATAVEIARRELSAICRSVGVLVPTDSTDLHNLPCMIHVRLKRRNDTGELQNEIKGYSRRESGAKSLEANAADSGLKTPGSSSAPWKR